MKRSAFRIQVVKIIKNMIKNKSNKKINLKLQIKLPLKIPIPYFLHQKLKIKKLNCKKIKKTHKIN